MNIVNFQLEAVSKASYFFLLRTFGAVYDFDKSIIDIFQFINFRINF